MEGPGAADRDERVGVGVSMPRSLKERIDAFYGIGCSPGSAGRRQSQERSRHLERAIRAGMEALAGADWEARADLLRGMRP